MTRKVALPHGRCAALFFALVLTACTRPVQPLESQGHTALADPRPLAGHWRIELREGSPMERLPIVGEAEPWLVAELDLEPAADTVDAVISPRDSLVGTMTRTETHMGDTISIVLKASGRMESDGRVVVTATYPGPCPCATFTLTGVMADGEVNGHSEVRRTELIGRSRFRMRRR